MTSVQYTNNQLAIDYYRVVAQHIAANNDLRKIVDVYIEIRDADFNVAEEYLSKERNKLGQLSYAAPYIELILTYGVEKAERIVEANQIAAMREMWRIEQYVDGLQTNKPGRHTW